MLGLLFEFLMIHIFDFILWGVFIGVILLGDWLLEQIGFVPGLIILLVIMAVCDISRSSNDSVADSYEDYEEPAEDEKQLRYGDRDPGLLDIWAEGAEEHRCHNCQYYFCGHCMLQNDDVEMRHTCNRFRKE